MFQNWKLLNLVKILLTTLFLICLLLLFNDFNETPKVKDLIYELFIGGFIAEIALINFKQNPNE